MCGITGFIQYKGGAADELTRRCQAMADSIAHRGPDAGGVWVDSNFPMALGHRRLSIIDLSAAGAQPMASASGRSPPAKAAADVPGSGPSRGVGISCSASIRAAGR